MKNKQMYHWQVFPLLISILIFIIGCGGGAGTSNMIVIPEGATEQDRLIFTRLATLSSGGVNDFVLPDSPNLNAIPQDPKNPLTPEKIELGKLLFHETGLLKFPARPEGLESASCASCHNARAGFQSNRFQAIGEGGLGFGQSGEARTLNSSYPLGQIDTQPIRTPTALNGAYQKNHHWNGQFGATGANLGTESLWVGGSVLERNNLGFEGVETQAIASLGIHRMTLNKAIADEFGYTQLFDEAFPTEPAQSRYSSVTAGLAIAAYERTLLANQSPWQRYLKGELLAMTESQKRGATLFFGKANCFNCHTGPALNENNFRAIGLNDLHQRGDANNASPLAKENLGRGGFSQNPQDNFKFKTPQLYNLADSAHYGHGSSFHSVRELIEYKNLAISQNPNVPQSQLDPLFKPLNLSPPEIDDLTSFLVSSLRDPNLIRYQPNSILSENDFPVNDP